MARRFLKSKSLRKYPVKKDQVVVATRLRCVGLNRMVVSHMAKEAAREVGCFTARQACVKGKAAAVATCRSSAVEDFKDSFYRGMDRARGAGKVILSGKRRR